VRAWNVSVRRLEQRWRYNDILVNTKYIPLWHAVRSLELCDELNPWSAFIEALVRRWLFLAVSLFCDNLGLWTSTVLVGETSCTFRLFSVCWAHPLAKEKSERLSCSGEFLGLMHSTEDGLSKGTTTFSPRERIIEFLDSLVDRCFGGEWCEPSDANKIRGIRNFTSAANKTAV